MKRTLLLMMVSLLAVQPGNAEDSVLKDVQRPVPVIFDTDVGNDVDDVLALAMLHALQSRAVCNLLAVTITNPDPKAVPFVDALNTFYGRSNIPIGRAEGNLKPKPSKFLSLVESVDGGQFRYPHRMKSGEDGPGAVKVLRKVLSAQADGSVVIIQVGFFSNLSALLESKPDECSELEGMRLVEKKVRLLSVMAGAFREAEIQKHFLEFNVVNDIASARKVAARWPTPMVWSGFEIGISLPYPAGSILNDYNYVPHHLVADAYKAFDPPPHERPTWDLTSALFPLSRGAAYFDLSTAGSVVVEADGFVSFQPKQGGRDRYLILPAGDEGRIKEALTLLASQPPGRDGAEK